MTKRSMAKWVTIICLWSLFVVVGASPAQKKSTQGGGKPKAGVGDCAHVDDATLAANVKDAISKNSQLQRMDIRVATKNRIVTLTGVVSINTKKQLAGNVAKSVACVKSVVNKIKVSIVLGCDPPAQECCCDNTCICVDGPCPECPTKPPKPKK